MAQNYPDDSGAVRAIGAVRIDRQVFPPSFRSTPAISLEVEDRPSEFFPVDSSGWLRAKFLASCICICIGVVPGFAADKAAKRTAVIFAIDPTLRGQNVGTTIFQNHSWFATEPAFDPNAIALALARNGLKRQATIVDGNAVLTLADGSVVVGLATASRAEAVPSFRALSEEWDVDEIVLVQAWNVHDWIGGTTETVTGTGVYRREVMGLRVAQIYCVLKAQVFDRRKGRMVRATVHNLARKIPRVTWFHEWAEFRSRDQKAILYRLPAIVEECTTAVLSDVGLMDPSVQRSTEERKAVSNFSTMELNEIEIPPEASHEVVRKAIALAMAGRHWVVTEDTPERIVGVLREGAKEAIETATITKTKIVLVPEMYKVKADGTRIAAKPNLRWHRNLFVSIEEQLLTETFTEADSESQPPAADEEPVP